MCIPCVDRVNVKIDHKIGGVCASEVALITVIKLFIRNNYFTYVLVQEHDKYGCASLRVAPIIIEAFVSDRDIY